MMNVILRLSLCAVLALLAYGGPVWAVGDGDKALVRVNKAEAAAFAREEKVALVVGIGQYPDGSGLSKLDFAARDAEDVGGLLEQLDYKVVVLKNQQATGGVLMNQLDALGQLIDRGKGTFLFMFSGHGFSKNNINYIAPFEASSHDIKRYGLKLTEILAALKQTGAKRQVMLIDACRDDPHAAGGKSVVGGRSFVDFDEAEGHSILFSTKFGRKSWEYAELGHGVFSHFVLKGLQGGAAGADGLVTFRSLFDYVRRRVKEYGFPKKIQVPFIRGERSGDFLLAKVSLPTSLIVKATPAHARVRLLNISPRYRPGMTLTPGDYHIEVTADGFKPYRQWVALAGGAKEVFIDLVPIRRVPGPGETFQDQMTDGRLGPEMVVIPAGEFMMGSPQGEAGRDDDEGPRHRVTIAKPFAVGKHEVTVGEFRRFV